VNKHIMTMIIPTYNRSDRLVSLVEYLINIFDLTETKILILDGSDTRMINPSKDWEQNSIYYKYYGSDMPILERWLDGLKNTDTELVGIVADDDIPHPEGYRKCIEFLQANKEYNVAHGTYTGFEINNHNKINYYSCYKPFSIEDDNPIQRLYNFLNNYVPITYAVYRTEVLKTAFQEVVDSVDSDDYHWFELLLGCIPVVLGKVKYLNYPYYARNYGVSIQRPSIIYYRLFYDESFSSKYRRIKDAILRNFLSREDIEKISDGIDISFAAYHSSFFNKNEITKDFNALVSSQNNGYIKNYFYNKLKIIYQKLYLTKNQILGLFHNDFFSTSIKKAYFNKNE